MLERLKWLRVNQLRVTTWRLPVHRNQVTVAKFPVIIKTFLCKICEKWTPPLFQIPSHWRTAEKKTRICPYESLVNGSRVITKCSNNMVSEKAEGYNLLWVMLNITSEGQLRVERWLKKLNCCILVDRFHSFYLLASTCNGSGLINFPSLECPCVNIMDKFLE